MAGKAGDYHRGDMNVAEQKATFHGFIGMTKWGSLAIAVGLIFLVLTFCLGRGFFQAAGAALVVLVLGVLALREKAEPAH